MEINRAKLASGDPAEWKRLTKTIRPASALSKQEHPLASQFFGDNGTEVRSLDLDTLLEDLAGQPGVEHDLWVQRMAALGFAGVEMNRPKVAGDVSQIGTGAGSGWTAPKPSIASGAKAATDKLARALLLNRLVKAANPSTSDSGVLVETLKSICTQLLGLSVENFNAAELKEKIAATVKANPALKARLAKALSTAEPDVPNVTLADLVAMGATVKKDGSRLSISV
jgi:hypothetical protein